MEIDHFSILRHDGTARSLHLCADGPRVDSSISKSIIFLFFDTTESPDLSISALTAHASTRLYRNRPFLYVGTRRNRQISKSLHWRPTRRLIYIEIDHFSLLRRDGVARSLHLCVDGKRVDPSTSKSIISLCLDTTESPDLSISALTANAATRLYRNQSFLNIGTRRNRQIVPSLH